MRNIYVYAVLAVLIALVWGTSWDSGIEAYRGDIPRGPPLHHPFKHDFHHSTPQAVSHNTTSQAVSHNANAMQGEDIPRWKQQHQNYQDVTPSVPTGTEALPSPPVWALSRGKKVGLWERLRNALFGTPQQQQPPPPPMPPSANNIPRPIGNRDVTTGASRTEWPELIGTKLQQATMHLRKAAPGKTLVPVISGSVVTMDYSSSRIRIYYHPSTMLVVSAPRVG
jgi:hypothetical protein